MMRKLLPLIFIALIYFSCQKNGKDIEQLKREIIKTDRDFSNLSLQKGFQKAFLTYASDDVVLLRQKNFPILGKEHLKKHYSNHPNVDIVLKWEPVKVDVSPDGIVMGNGN